MEPGNGVILQLMDNDEAGMDIGKVKVPDREDVYLEGRDLTKIDPENDVHFEFIRYGHCRGFL